MPVERSERLNSILKRVLAESIFRILQSSAYSPGIYTVTAVNCAKDMRDCTVRVSVFAPTREEKERALGVLVHHARDFQAALNREVRMKFTPRLRFVLDESLEKGDHVLAILSRMENKGARDGEPAGDSPLG